jgi:hypothetical protein
MKTGRPKIEVDWKQVDKMLAIQCTAEEIGSVLGVSTDTISRRCEEENECTFAEYSRQKAGLGKISLRRSQFKLAEKNAAVAIWLGKQYLGQQDKYQHELSGPDGGPIDNKWSVEFVNPVKKDAETKDKQ